MRWSLPTSFGSRWLYSWGETLIADACNPALCANADGPTYGGVRIGREIGDIRDGVGYPHHLDECAVGKHVQTHLGDQAADHGEDIRVAGSLAVSVGGALRVGSSGGDGGESVGDGATRVVLGMDAEPDAGSAPHRGHRLEHAHGQHSAVGVAQHAHVGAGRQRDVEQPHAVVGIMPVAVEEVLAVEEHPTSLGAQEAHRVAHHRQVLVERRVQRLLDMDRRRTWRQG